MKKSNLSLKWLEAFQMVARAGSVQQAAELANLSVSTVSHHLRKLEAALGAELIDHSRRPIRLTPAGTEFLSNINEALQLLRKAELSIHTSDLADVSSFGLAMVEDFDSDIGPELARALAGAMPNCRFRHLTRPSHDILGLLQDGDIQVGVAARPQFDQAGLIEMPVLRDPFVLAVPNAPEHAPEAYLEGHTGLPFLRYSADQIMGAQIESQLRRHKAKLPETAQFESNQSIMNMVAGGDGWTITTPTNFMRAQRFHEQITLMPFPGKSFARYLSVFTTEMHDARLGELVAGTLRKLVQTHAIAPTVQRHPWLAEVFRLLPTPQG